MKKYLLGAAAGALLCGGGSAAMAQSAPVTAGPEKSVGLEEVVVTAQRREEVAQNVGIALSVLSGQDLVDKGVVTVNQLQYATPSLEVVPAFGSGQPQFRLRGVGFDDYASNNTSPVTVYVDEVAYAFPVQTQGLLYDIDRVEVLRGPQGTLYGRNTTGGAINFITKRPTRDFTAGLTAEYGRFNDFKAEGYVGGPISDTLRFRLSATTEQGGGWQHNRTTGEEIGDADKWAARAQLEWDASDKVNVRLSAHYARDKSDGQGLYLFRDLAFNGAGFVPADQDHSQTGWGGSSIFSDFAGFAPDTKPFRDNEAYGLDGYVTADFGTATLTSITSFERFRRREYEDWDASQLAYAGTYFDTHAHTFSQEVRLASNTPDRPLSWVGGLYYSSEVLNDRFDSDFWQSLGFVTDTRYDQRAESIAGFLQTDYKFNDKLDLILGGRVENEKRSLGNFVTSGLFAPGVGGDFIPPTDNQSEHTQFSGKAELEYHPADQVMLYASLSRGIKSGGFTAYNTPDVKLLHEILPEKLLAYEAGFKSTFADNTVRLNGAMFYYHYQDQQVQSAIFTNFGPIGNIVNADSHIWGGELELEWRPLPQLLVTQALGYKKGTFTSFTDLDIDASNAAGHAVFRDRSGEDQGYPAWSYNGSVSYTFDLGDFDLEAEGDWAFHDTLNPVLLGPTYKVDSYWLANANLTLSPKGKPWSVGLWGRNIFNEKYDLTRNFFLPGISIAAPGRPATYGVRVSVGF